MEIQHKRKLRRIVQVMPFQSWLFHLEKEVKKKFGH